MIYAHARILFDEMDMDAKYRVCRTFDLIRMEDGFPRVYDAFVRAVEIEAHKFPDVQDSSYGQRSGAVDAR
jgi:hypothetical protein